MDYTKKASATIYHHNDPDGYFGAAVSKELLKSMYGGSIGSIKYNSVNYPKVFPVDKMDENDIVVLVDVSFGKGTFDQLKSVCKKASKVYWIDHHATSLEVVHLLSDEPIENLTHFVATRYCGAMNAYICFMTDLLRDPNKADIVTFLEHPLYVEKDLISSGIKKNDTFLDLPKDTDVSRLDGRFFIGYKTSDNKYKMIPVPKFLVLVDDYDCFKEKFDDSNSFIYAIRNYDTPWYLNFNKEFNRYAEINDDKFDHEILTEIIKGGKLILDWLRADYDNELRNAFEYDFSEYGGPSKAICMNSRGNSFVFGKLFEEYDLCCLFHYDKNVWKYSLYSNPQAQATNGVDCSKIAANINPRGGGHKGASGCSTDKLIFKF